jgi:hypothetical protein
VKIYVTFTAFEVVLIKVSVTVAPLPLPAVLLIPVTAALVHEKVKPPVALVAVYDVDTLLQRLVVVELVRV